MGLASTLYAAVATLAAGCLGCGRWLAATQARHSRFSDDGGSRKGLFQICWVICRIMHAFVDVAQVSEAHGIERPQSGC